MSRRPAAVVARRARALLLAVPAAVLLAALATVCWHTGTWFPWASVVHEDGHRTLLGTIFFFEHAARELPLDLLLAGASAAAARSFYSPSPRGREGVLPAMGALVSVAAILAGAAVAAGPDGLVRNLSQMHTRPGAPLEWGAHWRYHLLERLAGMLLAFAAFGLYARFGEPGRGPRRPSARPFAVALGLFALTSLVFGINARPFTDAVYLGHQARELFTHGLVTIPLAVGACLRVVGPPGSGSAPDAAVRPRMSPVYLAGLAAVLIGAYLAVGAVATGASSQAQTNDLVAVVVVHFFEHSLTYVVVPLTAMALCQAGRAREDLGLAG